jgi:hypothetical protein
MAAVRTRLPTVIAAAALLVAAAACTRGSALPSPTASALTPTSTSVVTPPSATPSATITSSPSVEPVVLPPGVPATYPRDVEPGDLPPAALVPDGAEVTGTSFAGPEAVIVTYASGGDPFAREQGLVVWRRFPGGADPWRARLGFRDKPNAGVLGIQVETADVTGDGEPDAISFENVGGSGVCGTWRVLALSAAADTQTYERDLCDATVTASAKPVGIRLTESVFGPGDPHCCPSATRETVLVWTDPKWKVATTKESPT